MTATPVVGTVPDTSLADPEAAPGALINAIIADPDALVYFLVNVGDGDTQLFLLPPDSNDHIGGVSAPTVLLDAESRRGNVSWSHCMFAAGPGGAMAGRSGIGTAPGRTRPAEPRPWCSTRSTCPE
jgi:hypothetical protein